MNEKMKFTLLLIVMLGLLVVEIIHLFTQIRTVVIQSKTKVKVFPKGPSSYAALFSILVGFIMIYTFVVSDSFVYNNSNDISDNLMKLGYKPWHYVYNLGKFVGILIIVNAVLAFFGRFAIDKEYIITNTGTKLSASKCMMAKSGDIVTVTYRPNSPKMPSVVLKYSTSSESGKKAYEIMQENYKTL